MENVRIAVIGLGKSHSEAAPACGIIEADDKFYAGPAGLTAIKNLREEGFDAVGFERRDKVGGLWSFSSDTSYTSVIQGTVSNISKFVVSRGFQVPRASISS